MSEAQHHPHAGARVKSRSRAAVGSLFQVDAREHAQNGASGRERALSHGVDAYTLTPVPMPPSAASSRAPLRLAYLTNKYPAVSHTFIRREILELERRGHHVVRVAIRSAGGVLVDAADQREQHLTLHVLELPRLRLAAGVLRTLLTAPLAALRGLAQARALQRASDRGWLRHLAYWIEALFLLQHFARERIQHVHVHFGTNPAAVALLVHTMGGPGYSLTVHGPDEFDAPGPLALSAKVAEASFAVAISDFGAAQLKRWARLEDWSKVQVVRCTVGEAFLALEAPNTPGEGFVCVGRLSAQKGHFVLVEALRILRERGLAPRLVFAGDGELRGDLERAAAAAGVASQIEITGWIDERQVRERIRASRALVLASFAEGLPMVLMESFAVGRPVVATRIAGVPELVEDGVNGWLVTAGRADLMADALERCMRATPDELALFASRGKAAVRERHETQTEGAKLEALLLRAVAPPRPD
jgi:glycosyltransferase involved in cell wall biosynthesis